MTNRICLGQRNNGDYGFFASPAGVDALAAADTALSFTTTSGHVACLHQRGTVATNGTNWTGWVGFTALPYVPIVVAGYYDTTNGKYFFSQSEYGGPSTFTGTAGGIGPNLEVSTNQIRFKAYIPPTAGMVFHYAILRIPGGS